MLYQDARRKLGGLNGQRDGHGQTENEKLERATQLIYILFMV